MFIYFMQPHTKFYRFVLSEFVLKFITLPQKVKCNLKSFWDYKHEIPRSGYLSIRYNIYDLCSEICICS